jgi:O-antigen ligase
LESNTIVDQLPAAPLPPPEVSARARAGATLMIMGAFVLVLAWAPSELFDLERYLVPKALTLHVVALGLLLLGLVPVRRSEWDVPSLFMVAFVAWSALSAAFATNRWLALSALGVSFSSAVVFLAARAFPARLRWRVLGGILAAVVLGSALGIAQAYGLENAWLSDSRPPGGTFGNRNFLGHLAAIAAPALLMWTVCARRRLLAALGMLGIAVLVTAIVLTRSRAAWLGGIGGVSTALIGLWWLGRGGVPGRRWGRLAAAGVVAAAAVALAVLAPNQLDWNTDTPYASTLTRLADYQQGSGRGRLIQYQNSLALVRRDPLFGTGPGNWFVDYPLVTTRGDPAYAGSDIIPTNPWPSSDWVALISERGAVGALLLLLAGGAAIVAMLGEDRDRDPNRAAAAGGVAGVLSAALVCGAFDAVLLLAAPAHLTWAAVGLLLPRTPAPSDGGPRRVATLVALAFVVYTGAHTTAVALTASATGTRTLARAAQFAPGEHRLQLELAQRGRCENALRAARLMPNHPRVTGMASGCD